jgi:hypothetical protein
VGELRKWVTAAIALAVVVAVFFQIRSYVQSQEYERRVRVAEQFADSAAVVIVAESARADSAEARADSLASRVLARDTVFVTEVERVRVLADSLAPVACEPFIDEYDRLVVACQRDKRDALDAWDRQKEASARLRVALDAALASRDTLRTTLDSRPGPHNPFLPRLGFGLFAGVCGDGFACVGAGITLSWSL